MTVRGRSLPSTTAPLGAVVLLCLLGALVHAVSRPSPSPVPAGGSHQQSADSSAEPLSRGACLTDDECDDGLPCTGDVCDEGVCISQEIPNCVECEPTHICPTIEAVFVMDMSGSMRDEAAALCQGIGDVVAELALEGIQVTAHVLGVTDTGSGGFSCLTDSVVTMLGGDVPGPLAFCPFPDDISSFESWGPGTAIVADRFPWAAGATRVVIPMSDEGACNGSRPEGCTVFGEDRDAVDNAAFVAFKAGVVASVITGSGADACVRELARVMADSTGGVAVHVKTPDSIPGALRDVLLHVCTVDATCDDLDACTDADTCVSGVCRGTPNYDVATECCAPGDRTLTPIEDGDPCTDDVCDPLTGQVGHPPADAGIGCDDDDACTTDDMCDGAGGCAGTDINTFECTSDEDCFGAICDTDAGMCFCTHTPELCLDAEPSDLPDQTCYTVGDEITVRVSLGFSTRTIAGGDFLIGYDPSVLEFVDIVPGQEVDPASPFSLKLFRNIDEVGGLISFAVGIDLDSSGTQGPATMAAVTFRAMTACTTDELCFLDGNTFTTKLTDIHGQPVPFERCCTGEIEINGPPPAFACPESVAVNASAGTTTATIRWDPIAVQSECNPDLPFTCTASNSLGANVDALIQTGGVMPSGLSTFRCSATDACGADGSCEWTVEVRRQNTFEVSIELSPSISEDPLLQPLKRCIEFEFFSNCVQQPLVVRETLDFGLPFNLPGHANGVLLKVPAGQYACVTARDPLHTLRSSSPLQELDGRYVASFEGDPFFGGNWLIGGNLDGNTVIDILDFGLFVDQYLSRQIVHTPCGTPRPHADFNGDGLVDALDLTFVSLNFLVSDKDTCCPDAVAGDGPTPRTVVPLSMLQRAGVRSPARLDANRDGLFDLSDVHSVLMRERARPIRTRPARPTR